jgi:DNA repair protein RadD
MIQLRDYQQDEVQSIFDYYTAGNVGNPVVAAPTGTGKSVVIAEFCRRVLHWYPNQKIIVGTHVKELVEQNAQAMLEAWPTAPIGVYSAGLGSRDCVQSIIFGGIQSMVNATERFGLRHLMLVDEAHMVSPNDTSRYQTFIKGMKQYNSNFKTIGFTATAYRTGSGPIADSNEDSLFTDVCCDHTSLEKFNWFIDQGYLVPLVPKRTDTELDISNVGIGSDGDYAKAELQAAVDRYDITYKCCTETIAYAGNRRSWLVFASGVEHAEHVAQCFQMLGINAAAVHSKMPRELRNERIASFKNGTIRCLVNNGILTTGFNHKPLDLIVVLRPTASAGLWVQILGRGTRPYYAPGFDLNTREGRLAAIFNSIKQNCLVLDFAGNTRRLGPINDPVIPKKRGKNSTPGVAPIKICPACGVYNHASARECENPACRLKFERQSKLNSEASEEELIRSDAPQIHEMQVQRILYSKWSLKGKPPMLKVSYFCGLEHAKDILCFEHTGFARTAARKWWRERSSSEPPESIDEALAAAQGGALREPKTIKVHTNTKYPKIVGYHF